MKQKKTSAIFEILKFISLPKKTWFILVSIFGSLALIGVGVGWFTGHILKSFFDSSSFDQTWESSKTSYFIMVFILLLIYLTTKILTMATNYIVNVTLQVFPYNLRDSIYKKFQRMPMSVFEREKTGDLMSAMTNDTSSLFETATTLITATFSILFNYIIAMTMMFIYAPLIASIVFLIVPVSGFVFLIILTKTRGLFLKSRRMWGVYNGFLEETLDILPLVRIHDQKDYVLKQFIEVSKKERDAGRRSVLYWHIIRPTYNFIKSFNSIFVIGICVFFYVNKISTYGITPLDFGVITSFSLYVSTVTNKFGELIDFTNSMQNGIASWDRIKRILDLEEINQDPSLKELKIKKAHIKFENVSFKYNQDSEKHILNNVSFEIQPNTITALVGHTGSGKSTIAKLLAQFYQTDHGLVSIDDQNANDYTQNSWRNQIATISQDVFLFETSIRNNLKNYSNKISDEEMIRVAKETAAHDFIEKLPDGYDTILWQNGANLSQGQRQLLSITRAVLSNKPIIIMDEATSNIDTITELQVQNAIKVLFDKKTILVIAHRLSTIRKADQILVMNKGEIIERGDHDLLIQLDGHYASLYKTGFEDKQD
ncbi:ABC transporter ATP-binding protein [Mycoplasma sp. Ms02]|uniref:ABC transporter ATP-binding protein n=1 Tax=Mycoplasma sp. Ms02 TaxID=353851 RepID=UPI001C893F2B|nr:ABC transporter ATP-binding protein [Mycoplasma sp. Ms02]QZE12160.1 ABC transporter ATP-binding protein/permease [Mycoplasma sp. Ms02]